MAIDMTTVKQIMHNNKEVVKIENGLGKVLWQKVTGPEWHTIWSGSVWVKRTTSGGENIFSKSTNSWFYTLPTEYTKFRLTFTYSSGNVDRNYIKYYNNDKSVSSLTSPLIIDNVDVPTSSYINNNLVGIGYSKSAGGIAYRWYTVIEINNNRELRPYADGSATTTGESGTTQLTLTKIEAYY